MKFDKKHLEKILAEAVKTGLETQFGVIVKSFFSPTEKQSTESFGSSVLSAYLTLTETDFAITLSLIVAPETMLNCLRAILGSDLDAEDPAVQEGVGEFINIVSGIFRKQVNTAYESHLEMSCPEINNHLNHTEIKSMFLNKPAFIFETSIGDVFVAFEVNTIELSKKQSA